MNRAARIYSILIYVCCTSLTCNDAAKSCDCLCQSSTHSDAAEVSCKVSKRLNSLQYEQQNQTCSNGPRGAGHEAVAEQHNSPLPPSPLLFLSAAFYLAMQSNLYPLFLFSFFSFFLFFPVVPFVSTHLRPCALKGSSFGLNYLNRLGQLLEGKKEGMINSCQKCSCVLHRG